MIDLSPTQCGSIHKNPTLLISKSLAVAYHNLPKFSSRQIHSELNGFTSRGWLKYGIAKFIVGKGSTSSWEGFLTLVRLELLYDSSWQSSLLIPDSLPTSPLPYSYIQEGVCPLAVLGRVTQIPHISNYWPLSWSLPIVKIYTKACLKSTITNCTVLLLCPGFKIEYTLKRSKNKNNITQF